MSGAPFSSSICSRIRAASCPHLLLVKAHRWPDPVPSTLPTQLSPMPARPTSCRAACRPECPHAWRQSATVSVTQTTPSRSGQQDQQLLHTALALFHGKGSAADAGAAVRRPARQRSGHPARPHGAASAGGIVPLCAANVNDPFAGHGPASAGPAPGPQCGRRCTRRPHPENAGL